MRGAGGQLGFLLQSAIVPISFQRRWANTAVICQVRISVHSVWKHLLSNKDIPYLPYKVNSVEMYFMPTYYAVYSRTVTHPDRLHRISPFFSSFFFKILLFNNYATRTWQLKNLQAHKEESLSTEPRSPEIERKVLKHPTFTWNLIEVHCDFVWQITKPVSSWPLQWWQFRNQNQQKLLWGKLKLTCLKWARVGCKLSPGRQRSASVCRRGPNHIPAHHHWSETKRDAEVYKKIRKGVSMIHGRVLPFPHLSIFHRRQLLNPGNRTRR